MHARAFATCAYARADEKVKAAATVDKELCEADSLVQQMDLEVRSMAGAVRSELQGRVRGYKAALGEMKSRTLLALHLCTRSPLPALRLARTCTSPDR